MGFEGQPRIQQVSQDSPLGSWTLEMRAPSADLAELVDQLWLGEGRVNYAADRILPSGVSHLLINLGPPQYLLEHGPTGTRRTFVDIWLSGPHQRPIDTSAPHGQRLLGVAFKPGGLFPWLPAFTASLQDAVVPLADVLGDQVLALRQRLLESATAAASFELVEAWLRRRLIRSIHPHTRAALRMLARSRGQREIESIQAELGCSRNHLASVFRREVGLAPKALARLHRFGDALNMLRGCTRVPWVELAAHCGYYDQSHLIRDFHSYTGMAPGEFARLAQPDAGSVVLR